MPEAASSKGGVSKKAGPLPLWGWFAVAAGTYLVYRLYETYKANQAAAAATGLTAGSTIPTDVVTGQTGTTSSGTNPPLFSSLGQWSQALLDGLPAGVDPADALNGVTAWLSGSCVSAGQYATLASSIGNGTIGLPPGFSVYPTLSVCPGSATSTGTSTGGTSTATSPASQTPSPAAGAPVNLPDSIAKAMVANGESIISEQWDQKLGEWIFATNKGGIYGLQPNGQPGTFYGSYLGLPAADTQGGPRTFQGLTIDPTNGNYTLTDTHGANYTFTPTTPQKTAA